MAQATAGDTVRIHYTGTLSDGSVFDSSEGRGPLEFTVGVGQVIPGFDSAVEGMKPGETQTVEIPAEKAYGPLREEMMLSVSPDQFPDGMEPEIGQQLQLSQPDGQAVVVRVTEIADDEVILDANHELAGQDLTFEITLEEIVGG
ncbi:MAG: peptidylprolyl isomerase [Rhodothermales bacterium]